MAHFSRLLSRIAAAALQAGLLIRGGATIGKLYHANGISFGEAMIEAFRLETRTAIYPRVVLSPKITKRKGGHRCALKDEDGIWHVDYIGMMLLMTGPTDVFRPWLECVVSIIEANVKYMENKGRLNELAKWTWFAKRFHAALEPPSSKMIEDLGMSEVAAAIARLTSELNRSPPQLQQAAWFTYEEPVISPR
jgi:hypothetical protein